MAINLSKGGNINLSKTAPTMNKVDLGLGWNPRVTDGKAFDLDAVAFLTGENGKDGGQLCAHHARGHQGKEKRHRERDEAQHRHRLQDVQRRDQQLLGATVARGQRGVGEGEQQRCHHGRQHAQGGAQRIFRQHGRIQ